MGVLLKTDLTILEAQSQYWGIIMKHRHLTGLAGYSSAAIDDIIGNGKLSDWHELRDASDADISLVRKILRICLAHCSDPYAQRYHLWRLYAEQRLSS